MDDAEFNALQVKAAVTPQMEAWPEGDFEVSLTDGKPTATGELHWSTLRSCVDCTRTHVLKAFGAMAAIDEDRNLNPTGKAEKKREIATKAIADLEGSKSLEKARATVEHQVAKWNEQLGLIPKAPESVSAAMIHAEIRSHLAAMKVGDRVAFIDAHASEVAAAVLTAPSFLSGLTPAELGIVKQRIEAHANPEVAKAKAETTQALADAEQGWRSAIAQIRDRAGLGKVPQDGATA